MTLDETKYCIDFFSVRGNFSAFFSLILQSNTYFIKRKLHYKLAVDTEQRPFGPHHWDEQLCTTDSMCQWHILVDIGT